MAEQKRPARESRSAEEGLTAEQERPASETRLGTDSGNRALVPPLRPRTRPNGQRRVLRDPTPSEPAWCQDVRERIAELRSEARALGYAREPLLRRLDDAEAAVVASAGGDGVGSVGRFLAWWRGTYVEQAWRNVHLAEEGLISGMEEYELRPRLPGLYAYVRRYLDEQHPEALALRRLVDGHQKLNDEESE